jgi:Asparagine synthase
MERVRVPHIDPRFPTAAAGGSYVDATCGALQFACEIEERTSSAAGLQVAYPFHDRRLAEFGMAVPERELWRGDLTKIVVRRALEDLLPPSVRWRRTKTDPAPVIVTQLMTPDATAALGRLRLAEDGLVEQRQVTAMLAEMIACYRRGESGFDPLACRLWPILMGEIVWTTLFAAGGMPRISTGENDDRFEPEVEPTHAHT